MNRFRVSGFVIVLCIATVAIAWGQTVFQKKCDINTDTCFSWGPNYEEYGGYCCETQTLTSKPFNIAATAIDREGALQCGDLVEVVNGACAGTRYNYFCGGSQIRKDCKLN